MTRKDFLSTLGSTVDLEGTVDGTHPNDLGMMTMAKAFGDAVADALVRRCRTLMEANVGRSFNVTDLVASLGVSRRTLHRKLREWNEGK